MANSLYGLALLGVPHGSSLVEGFARELARPSGLRTWPEQHASIALYALGILGYEAGPGFWEVVVAELLAPGCVDAMSDVGLAAVAYALSLLRVRAPRLLAALCDSLWRRGAGGGDVPGVGAPAVVVDGTLEVSEKVGGKSCETCS